MDIKYRHKETGFEISLEEIKRLRNEQETIHLHENRRIRDINWNPVESIKSYEYDYDAIILGVDFETICIDTEFTIDELEQLLHACMNSPYLDRSIIEKIKIMFHKKRMFERL